MLAHLLLCIANVDSSPPVDLGTVPCERESAGCPRYPCPSPPPDISKRCILEANPLVLRKGLCCREFPCGSYSCPSKCAGDSAGQFDKAGKFCDDGNGNHTFDCSQSAAGQRCYDSIVSGQTEYVQKCACLARDCHSTADLLREQSSACVIGCRTPESAEPICPNYDDEHDWCRLYARWLCVRETSSCDASKLAPSACEARCQVKAVGKRPSDRLDAFLICMGECIGAQDVEANEIAAVAAAVSPPAGVREVQKAVADIPGSRATTPAQSAASPPPCDKRHGILGGVCGKDGSTICNEPGKCCKPGGLFAPCFCDICD